MMDDVVVHFINDTVKKYARKLFYRYWKFLSMNRLRILTHFCWKFKDVVSCSGAFWKLISRFFMTKYNIIVSIFLCIFIGIINYKKICTIFNTILYRFLSQSRQLQIEVGGLCGWFWHLESSDTKKQKRLLLSMVVALSRTRIKHFYQQRTKWRTCKKNLNFFSLKIGETEEIIIIIKWF